MNGFLLKKVKKIFELDLRSLALYRMGIALFALNDLFLRATALRAHYTDFGLLPRKALVTEPLMNPWRFSIHLMNGGIGWQAVLFLMAAIFALMLLVGFRTRLASFGLWLLTISLQARNPMILQGGDVLYRMSLFFGMFLPLNGRYSIDNACDSAHDKKPALIFSAGSVAFTLQVIFVYFFSVGIKWVKPESRLVWWTQGMAVYNALNIDQFTRDFGYFLLSLPLGILKFLNYYTLGIELFAPFLLIFPFKNNVTRLVAIFLIFSLHLGMGTALSLGLFPFIGTVTLLPLIPSGVWDFVERRFTPRHPEAFYAEGSAFGILRCAQDDAVKWIRRLPARPLQLGLSLPAQILAGFSILYILFWNLGTVGFPYSIPSKLRGIGYTFQFDQYWDMFSPPLTDDGWFVIPGRLRNGKEVDLFRGGALPLVWEKPKRVSSMYPHERWRKYMMNLWLQANEGYRLYYGQYLCRHWNSSHPAAETLEEFQILYMKEETRFYQTASPKKVSVWRHFCLNVPPAPLPPSKWETGAS